MLEIIREYSFDVNFEAGKFKRTDGSTERIKLIQNDNESTKFKFNFEEEIVDNTNVLVRLRQSTGYVKEYTMLIQNQKAEIILTNDILSESGSLTMSITLIGTDDEILTDTEYHSKIQVIASLEGDTEIPEQEKSVLVDLISQVNSLNQTASQLVEDTETAVTNSSTVLANAETALQNANTATSNANQAAESANNAVTELDNRLANKVDKVSGKSLSTNDFTNEYKQKLENLENYDDSEILQELNNKANITDIPDISNYQTKIDSEHKLSSDLVDDTNNTNKFVTASEKATWDNKSNFSGSYNDLTNKPTIPSEVTETTISNWGFTKNSGTYNKPQTGIPKTDLTNEVQTSLGKADTALQSYTEQYTGTITGITMNGESIGTSGVVDLGTVITEHQDISSKENKANKVTLLNSSSTDEQYPSAKTVYDNFVTRDEEIGNKVDKVQGKSLVADETISWLTSIEENYDTNTIEKGIENFFALTQDDGIYTVKFPMWDTSNTCDGEKLDKNIGKFLNLATDTVYEETNYGEAFKTYDCNAYVDNNGVRHITALKGMSNFKDTGKVDVFVLIRTYYEKFYEKDGYMYYSRTYTPKEGFTPVSQAINKDGTINPWFLIAKYAAGMIVDNNVRKPYSSKGLKPARHINNPTGACSGESDSICYNNNISIFQSRGAYYTAGLMADYKHIKTTIWLKFATKNSQSIIMGNTNYNLQYGVAQTESNVSRVILTNSQAANFDLHTFVSVGDRGSTTTTDRINGYMHNLANDVEIIGKEVVDSLNTALILDCEPFTTTNSTYVSTMHEHSGYSDYVLGRNGSRISNTNGKHGAVIDGIECFVGGYEVPANAFMDIVDGLTRDIYVTNDATKLTTNVTTAKSTYKKVANQITTIANSAWKYITEEKIDLVNGVSYPTKSGQTGSGSATGYADGYYADTGTSGQREVLLLGVLGSGANAGVSILCGYIGVGSANWTILARLSINAVGGELTS